MDIHEKIAINHLKYEFETLSRKLNEKGFKEPYEGKKHSQTYATPKTRRRGVELFYLD